MWVATRSRRSPSSPCRAPIRAIWMANETSRQNTLEQVSALVSLGTPDASIEDGQGTFQAARPKWQLR